MMDMMENHRFHRFQRMWIDNFIMTECLKTEMFQSEQKLEQFTVGRRGGKRFPKTLWLKNIKHNNGILLNSDISNLLQNLSQ